MTYNIHPLFVHFPIAFLLLYSVLKIIPFNRFVPKIAWQHVRFVVLCAGVLGAMVASSTGEIAEHIVRPDHHIVEMHALFAAVSTWIYALLLGGELLHYINPYIMQKFSQNLVVRILHNVEHLLTHQGFSLFLSIIGVITISVTGLLGGVMVYGTSADPIAPLVLTLLGIE